MTAEGTPFFGKHEHSVTSDMQRLRKTLTYLLTTYSNFLPIFFIIHGD